ncbi:hypothetical protein B7486_56610 [cyanobacterium TDX16]|nr:hypothetical protein B7486_56610 [cyanobacterium TDX16]
MVPAVLGGAYGLVFVGSADVETTAVGRVVVATVMGGVLALTAWATHGAHAYGALRPLRPEHRVEVLQAVRHGGTVSRADLHGYVVAFAERELHQDERRWFEHSRLVRLLLALWAPVLLLAWWASAGPGVLWAVPMALGAVGAVATRAIVVAERRRVPNRMRAHDLAFPHLGIGADDILRP